MENFSIFTNRVTPLAQAETSCLPEGLNWQTNSDFKPIGSPKATKGGTLKLDILGFPATLREEGPEASNFFIDYLHGNERLLVRKDPNTGKIIPDLADYWAVEEDKKTVYFRIIHPVKWSDGKPLRGVDFEFIPEFKRSPHIKDPWSNKQFKEVIADVKSLATKKGELCIRVSLVKPHHAPLKAASLRPKAKHFFGKLDKNFVKKFNWKPEPTVGPYYIDKVKKGKSLTFKRVKNWWGENYLVTAIDLMWIALCLKFSGNLNQFSPIWKSCKLHVFKLDEPRKWQQRKDEEIFKKGYAHVYKNYNERPRAQWGIDLNTSDELLSNLDIRQGLHHAMNFDWVLSKVLANEISRSQGVSRVIRGLPIPKLKQGPLIPKKPWNILLRRDLPNGIPMEFSKGLMEPP